MPKKISPELKARGANGCGEIKRLESENRQLREGAEGLRSATNFLAGELVAQPWIETGRVPH